MGKRKKNLNYFTKSLMHFCLQSIQENNFPRPLINHNVTDNFWESIHWDSRFKGTYSSFELVENFICDYMLNYQKKTVEEVDISNFLDELEIYLRNNLQDYWLIAPLTGALLAETIIESDNLIIIDGNKPEAQDYLKQLIGEEFYNYITESRFKSDYKDVLIGYKIKCQSEYIDYYCNIISYYLNAILHLYYYSNIFPSLEYKKSEILYAMRRTFRLPMRDNKDVKRLILSSTINPMRRDAIYNTECKIDLSFLGDKEHFQNFLNLTDYLLKEVPTKDEVIKKLLNSLKIFKSAVSLEEKDSFTGISVAIVLLTTASESLLLKHSDPKRDTLKSIYSSIYHGTDFDVEEIVDKVYTLRSEFVHGGTFTFKDFNDDFSEGPNTVLFNKYKQVFTKGLYIIIQHILNLEPSERTIENFENYISSHKEN